MRTRAERRFFKRKAIKKVEKAYPDLGHDRAARLADNFDFSQTVFHRNPRHWAKGKDRLPIQERRKQDIFEDTE